LVNKPKPLNLALYALFAIGIVRCWTLFLLIDIVLYKVQNFFENIVFHLKKFLYYMPLNEVQEVY
jgi:hypothetical protein